MKHNVTTWQDMVEINYPISDINKGSKEFEIMNTAAKNGCPSAQHSMGIWYEAIAKDFEEAEKWYKRAADQGHEGAQEAYNSLNARPYQGKEEQNEK